MRKNGVNFTDLNTLYDSEDRISAILVSLPNMTCFRWRRHRSMQPTKPTPSICNDFTAKAIQLRYHVTQITQLTACLVLKSYYAVRNSRRSIQLVRLMLLRVLVVTRHQFYLHWSVIAKSFVGCTLTAKHGQIWKTWKRNHVLSRIFTISQALTAAFPCLSIVCIPTCESWIC